MVCQRLFLNVALLMMFTKKTLGNVCPLPGILIHERCQEPFTKCVIIDTGIKAEGLSADYCHHLCIQTVSLKTT